VVSVFSEPILGSRRHPIVITESYFEHHAARIFAHLLDDGSGSVALVLRIVYVRRHDRAPVKLRIMCNQRGPGGRCSV
jgi:hypothetical protein